MSTNFIVTIDNKPVEIDPERVQPPEGKALFDVDGDHPKGYYSPTQYQADIAKAKHDEAERFKGLKNPHDLIKDDAFKERFFRENGIQVDANGLPLAKLPDDYTAAVTERDRLKSENAEYQLREERTAEKLIKSRKSELIGVLRNQANQPETYVRRDLMESIFGDPDFLEGCAKQFEWSDDHDAQVFKDGAGNIVFDGQKPAGAKTFMEKLKASKGDRVFGERKQEGSDLEGDARRQSKTSTTRQALRDGTADLEAIASGKVAVR